MDRYEIANNFLQGKSNRHGRDRAGSTKRTAHFDGPYRKQVMAGKQMESDFPKDKR